MQFFCGKNRGAISVFLTLILVPVLIFSGIIVDASRLYASKTVISGAGDLTMNAALSRYDKELKDSYGLLAMAEQPESQQIKESLEQYFMESCNAFYLEGEDNTELHSMIQLELGNSGVNAEGVRSSSLANTQVLQQQILEYMKFRGPVYMVSDILEKFQKLPLQNMEEKKDYVEAKSDYGKEVSKLGDPLEKAKEYVEQHRNAAESLKGATGGSISSLLGEFRKQSAFWLAARSLENYLNHVTVAPMGGGTINSDTVRQNLAGSVVWSESQKTFSDMAYADLVAAISLYQLRGSLDSQLTEENGFTPEEVNTYKNIESTVRQCISNMDKIYDSAAKEYKDNLKIFEQEADTIIDTGRKGIDQLEKIIDIWEDKVQKAKDKCIEKEQILKDKGEDTTAIEEAWESEDIKINVDDARHLILVLESNIQETENAKEQLKKLKALPDNLRSQYVTGEEGRLLQEKGYEAGIEQYWNVHQIGMETAVAVAFQDVFQEKFYQETLQSVGEGEERTEAKREKDENEKEAESSQEQYETILATLEASQKEKKLENYEEISYPSEFPSGLAKVFPDITGSKKVDKIDVSGDDVSDVTNASTSMSGIEQFLSGLDSITGELLERAYLMEYITEMFNCLTTKEGEVSLADGELGEHYIYNGELEYILYGNSSTVINKLNSVGVLFALRLAINSVYVFFDKELNAQANMVASGVCTATGQAWLYPIVKYGYLFCRAIVMSGQDIVNLVGGKDVAVWPGNKKITLSYKEYMKLFILIALTGNDGEKKLVSRLGDCIQLNTGKKLSEKYTMLTLEAEVTSTTAFLPRVPSFLGRAEEESDGRKLIRYKGVLAY